MMHTQYKTLYKCFLSRRGKALDDTWIKRYWPDIQIATDELKDFDELDYDAKIKMDPKVKETYLHFIRYYWSETIPWWRQFKV